MHPVVTPSLNLNILTKGLSGTASYFSRVKILNGFLSPKGFIPKGYYSIFFSKGHYFKDLYPKGSYSNNYYSEAGSLFRRFLS